ncbi:hypothetical protein [Clavibacter michiganensis]|uniref:hypothetical protein n=1 Tax=Clavibacter michiganensis TaxID=28447 RepID=UPI0011AFD992|nr:hypothetical protein [Clavibacter michiganensis]
MLAKYGILDTPELVVVDSTQALTEMVSIGSRRWIVYDLHLGRIFARLNAIGKDDVELDSIDADLTRIYTGRLLTHGRAQAAYLVAMFHLNPLIDDLVVADENDLDNQRWIRAQEIFVLAHELMHFVFAEHSDMASRLTDMYFTLCEAEESDADERDIVPAEQVAESFAEDYNREWVRRHGASDPEMLAAGKKELVARYLKSIGAAEHHTSKAARDDVVLSEEVVCDAGAAVLTAIVLGQSSPDETLYALVAAFDANQKLRVITHMDYKILKRGSTPTGLSGVSLRGSQLRQFYRAIYESQLVSAIFGFEGTVTDHTEMLDQIRMTNMRFYAHIFDQLLTEIFYIPMEKFVDADSSLSAVVSVPPVQACYKFATGMMLTED